MAHPSGPGPNGNQFAPGMSPQGSRAGDPSPNPNEMNRGKSIIHPSITSALTLLGRGSPTPGMMDPSGGMRPQMVMGPNGQPVMRPPSSHPMAGQMTQQQMEMIRANGGMMPNGANWQGPPGGPQGPMMPGQQPGQQPGQPPNMTPRQGNMPPPPAPANATGTQPSSPAQQPAPPTPSQGNKGKPANKKDGAKKVGQEYSERGLTQVLTFDRMLPPTRRAPMLLKVKKRMRRQLPLRRHR